MNNKARTALAIIALVVTSPLLAADDVEPFPKQKTVGYDEVRNVTKMVIGIERPDDSGREYTGLRSKYQEKKHGVNTAFGVIAEFKGRRASSPNKIKVSLSWIIHEWRKRDIDRDRRRVTRKNDRDLIRYRFEASERQIELKHRKPEQVWILAYDGDEPSDDESAIRVPLNVRKAVGKKGRYTRNDTRKHWVRERVYFERVPLPHIMSALSKDNLLLGLPTNEKVSVHPKSQMLLREDLKQFADKYVTGGSK